MFVINLVTKLRFSLVNKAANKQKYIKLYKNHKCAVDGGVDSASGLFITCNINFATGDKLSSGR
ncbi:hypothetical protein NBRC116492_21770 [Aurantivibrio infirmus]